MTTTTNVHRVQSMAINQRPLADTNHWITELIAMNDKGETYSLTLFHANPMPIAGAEFVNFAAEAQEVE